MKQFLSGHVKHLKQTIGGTKAFRKGLTEDFCFAANHSILSAKQQRSFQTNLYALNSAGTTMNNNSTAAAKTPKTPRKKAVPTMAATAATPIVPSSSDNTMNTTATTTPSTTTTSSEIHAAAADSSSTTVKENIEPEQVYSPEPAASEQVAAIVMQSDAMNVPSTHNTNQIPHSSQVNQGVNPEHHFYTQKIRNLAYELDMMLKRRGYSTFRVLGLTALALGVLVFLFGEELKNFFSQHGADVASRSLESESVQMSAEVLSKAVVQQVLSDEKTIEHAIDFLRQLVSRQDTQQLLVSLLLQVLKDPTTQSFVSQFVKETVAIYLMQDEQTLQVASNFVYKIMEKQETKDQLVQLLNAALQDEKFRQQAAEMFASVILYDVVKKNGTELGLHAVHNVLDDEGVKQHSESFVSNVLTNQKVQHDAGFAIWEAVKVSVTPGWFYSPPKPEQAGEEKKEEAPPQEQPKPEEPVPQAEAVTMEKIDPHAITSDTSQPSEAAAVPNNAIAPPVPETTKPEEKKDSLPITNQQVISTPTIKTTSIPNEKQPSPTSSGKPTTSTEVALVDSSK